jgi:GTPase
LEPKRTNLKVGNELALLVHVSLPDAAVSAQDSLDELASLAKTAGAIVVGSCYQNSRKIHPACYVGSGKAEYIAQRATQSEANVVIFDNDLSPGQIRELEKITNRKVLDRSELILDIFASRAKTHEARLQVELAQLQYTYPRLTRMWSHLDTVTGAASGAVGAVGGIGTRGPGEKQLEIDRRLVKKRISFLKGKIDEIDDRKKREAGSRKQHFTVSIVGYTNAGKSTLMNLLTGANTLVENKLFATLDTKTALWNLGQGLSVLLSDTVGFVRALPHHLVASFRATLEEAIHADLLLHVLDVSHPQAINQLEVVNSVLKEIGCDDKDVLLLLNKVDLPEARVQRDTLITLYPDALPVSARSGIGVEKLIEAVIGRMTGEQLRLKITFPHSNGLIPSYLRTHGAVLAEQFNDDMTIIEASLGRKQIPALERLGPISCTILD